MPRLPSLTREELTDEQRVVWDAITAGPRGARPGGLPGPFNPLLRSPKLCDLAQQMGAYIRFESALPGKLRELAIITTARHWTAQYEWNAHARLAAREGLDQAVIDAIAQRRPPPFGDEAEAAVHRFCAETLGEGAASDESFEAVRQMLGEGQLTDLVGLMGYYTLVALTLNNFEIPLPEGATPLPT